MKIRVRFTRRLAAPAYSGGVIILERFVSLPVPPQPRVRYVADDSRWSSFPEHVEYDLDSDQWTTSENDEVFRAAELQHAADGLVRDGWRIAATSKPCADCDESGWVTTHAKTGAKEPCPSCTGMGWTLPDA